MNSQAASFRAISATFCIAVLLLANATFGEQPSQNVNAGPIVVIQIHVIELNLPKMRKLGVDMRVPIGTEFLYALSEDEEGNSDASRVLGFCEALRQFDCARIIAEPKMAIPTGREGSLRIDDQLVLKLLPLKTTDRTVELEYSLALSHPVADRNGRSAGKRQLAIASNFVGDMGKTHCLSATKRWTTDGENVPHESLLLMLLSADIATADELGKATPQTAVLKDVPQRVVLSDEEVERILSGPIE